MTVATRAHRALAQLAGHRRGLAILAALAVVGHLYGLYRPAGPPQPAWFPVADRVQHVIGFAVPVGLILLAAGASRYATGPARWRWAGRAWAVTTGAVFALHAALSELIQLLWYPARTGDPWDVVADGTGIALGVGAAWALARRDRGA